MTDGLSEPTKNNVRAFLASGMGVLVTAIGVFASWNALGWPTPVLSYELRQIESQISALDTKLTASLTHFRNFSVDTRIMTLNQELIRKHNEQDFRAQELTMEPANTSLRRLYQAERAEIARIEGQLTRLKLQQSQNFVPSGD